jgi:L-lactate utilization protein LutC
MAARDDIFLKMRTALGLPGADAPSDAERDALFAASVSARLDDPVASFMRMAAAAGSTAERLDDIAGATLWIGDYINRERITSAFMSSELEAAGIIDMNQLKTHCPQLSLGVDNSMPREEHTSSVAAIQLGIGSAVAGFADNGAIAIQSTGSESRALSLLTETHLAILHASDIRATFASYASELTEAADRSSAVTIVGGPSKTADIEKVLITGVHGPGRLVVLVLGSA